LNQQIFFEQFTTSSVLYKTGVVWMHFETKEQLRAKIAQSRRLQVQMTDQIDAESLKKFIEELEARLLLMMGSGATEVRWPD
jgi:hypothetical protein